MMSLKARDLQKKFLQVYDPKAMHTMFIKEIDIFEEAVQ